MKAHGEFSVNLQPLAAEIPAQESNQFNHFALGKTYEQDLNATSRGQMLSVNTSVKGSAGYVALEQVTGNLQGRTGSFVLQHYGIMHEGQDQLLLEVVPNSADGELKGLRGSMVISVRDGRHFYAMDYSFVQAPVSA